MGEEEKKPEERKREPPPAVKAAEEEKGKAEEGKGKTDGGDGNGGEKEKVEGEKAAENPPPPPPPEEVVMKVHMHCEGCAKKVRRCLWGFPGVEDVATDCGAHRVVVKGRKAAEDPLKVVERVQKKSGRKVELLSPLPQPPKAPEKEQKKEEKPKAEDKKEVILVVLKVYMHCGACAEEIKKWILRMKGVHAAEPDLTSSEVTVKGVFDPESLASYVRKRTGKHASVVKQEPAEKNPEEPGKSKEEDPAAPSETGKDDKKPGGAGKSDKEEKDGEKEDKEKKKTEGGGDGAKKDGPGLGGLEEKEKGEKKEEDKKEAADGGGEGKTTRNEFYYYCYPTHAVEFAYPPQIFSDENPNACAVM